MTVKKIIGLVLIALTIMPIIPMQSAQAYILGYCKWSPMGVLSLSYGNVNLTSSIWQSANLSILAWQNITPQITLNYKANTSQATIQFVSANFSNNNGLATTVLHKTSSGYCYKVVILVDENKMQGLEQQQIMQILGHEFGHALGVAHSDNPNSIMTGDTNPWQSYRTFVAGKDEFLALQELYGSNNISWGITE